VFRHRSRRRLGLSASARDAADLGHRVIKADYEPDPESDRPLIACGRGASETGQSS
jgi:hypothetical protein